ncbi:MAG: ABC-F family ATP-binding cassette domain-containing protein [bacterium]
MTFLTLENIFKSFGEKKLLHDVTFSIEKGEKLALVAKNGSGKTTLLKIIVGLEQQDAGKVIKKSGLKLGYLPQNPDFNDNETINDFLFDSDNEKVKAIKNYELCLKNPDDIDNMQNAFDDMEKFNAWDLEFLINDILNVFKLDKINLKISEMSGGQKKRLAIAKLLLDEPDLLILDEPTNHLDLEMIDWLQQYLTKLDITLLMITHDRYFLDSVCDTILELEYGNIYKHKGNYSYYLDKKEERENNELSTAVKKAQLLKKESNWVNKMPQGRGSKSVLRTDNYYEDLNKNSELKSYINVRKKKVELNIKESHLGKKILEFSNVSKSYPNKIILDKFSYIFRHKEKLGIIGPNGAGKTTFLNLIMGLIQPDSGHITHGETIQYGYFTQNGIDMDDNKTIINTVKDIAEYVTMLDGSKITASSMLEKFLFAPNIQHRKVATLSGGEKRRLYLLTVIISNPNFLILDEPTNDLDIMTLEVIEEFLINYKGCLIIVTHDRYFMDVIVDHLFVFEGEGVIKDYPGNYTDYREAKEKEEKGIKPAEKKAEISNENKIRIKDIEKEIVQLEEKKAKLSAKFVNETDYEKIRKYTEEVNAVVKLIEDKTEEWMKLTD